MAQKLAKCGKIFVKCVSSLIDDLFLCDLFIVTFELGIDYGKKCINLVVKIFPFVLVREKASPFRRGYEKKRRRNLHR